MDFGKLFFSAYGRIGRQEFWLGWVILLMVGLFTCFIPFINMIVGLGLIYCGVCIRSKRLHDMGRTGWWQIVPIVAHVVFLVILIYFAILAVVAGFTWNHIADGLAAAGILAGVATLAFTAITCWLIDVGFLLWMGIAERDPYDNIYGPGPSDLDYRGALPA